MATNASKRTADSTSNVDAPNTSNADTKVTGQNPAGTDGSAPPVGGTGGSDPITERDRASARENNDKLTTGDVEVPGQMSNDQLGLAASKRQAAYDAAGADSRVEALKAERRGYEQRGDQANVDRVDAEIDGLENPAEDSKDHDQARKSY